MVEQLEGGRKCPRDKKARVGGGRGAASRMLGTRKDQKDFWNRIVLRQKRAQGRPSEGWLWRPQKLEEGTDTPGNEMS